MLFFSSDYQQACHPEILRRISETNFEGNPGYGTDDHCKTAKEKIKAACETPDAEIFFIGGGTQTNLLVINAFLDDFECVICAHTGHINVHETGAIEATGHKVCTVYSENGKLTPAMVDSVVKAHSSEHMVYPRMVYISNSTEIGTIYTKAELETLSAYCKEHDLYLFMDGARLASALTAPDNDLTLPDLAKLTDAFYIGGTKNGLLFGEALVVTAECKHFRWHMKQRGAILAKGRLLGVMYQAALENGLYFDIARHANEQAARLRDGMMELGYKFPVPSTSNQQFALIPKGVVSYLKEKGYEFETERSGEEEDLIRFVTSWATPPAAIDTFLKDLAAAK